jgi:uncharacterized repeat protein (TIGR01451 family)
MNQVLSRLSKKGIAVLATVAIVFGATGIASAWFPDRPTYTIQQPADHVTFNSITNNPDEGDERAFFEVKDATNTQPNGFLHTATNLTSGQELLLRVYVHNNAADNLNGTNFDGPGVAKNTKVRIYLPTANAQALRANAYISADNATPREVSDSIDLSGTGPFSLEYVPGSAVQYTNAVPSGIKLSDSIVTTGAPIGYNQADGIVPGCFQYSSIVTVKVKVKAPAYSVAKTVRLEGQTAADWKETVQAKAGQNVEWRVEFKNNGNTALSHVKLVDNIPAGLTVVPGSIKLYNGNNPNGVAVTDAAIQASGRQINVDIGNYNPASNAIVVYKTKVAADKDIACGGAKYTNVAYVTPEGLGTVNDTAEATVAKVCQPTTPTTPKQLPNTGAGDVIGIFSAVTVAGALAHRYVWARRFARG